MAFQEGMRSPSEILYSLSITPSQLFTFSYLHYLVIAALCWWAKNNTKSTPCMRRYTNFILIETQKAYFTIKW